MRRLRRLAVVSLVVWAVGCSSDDAAPASTTAGTAASTTTATTTTATTLPGAGDTTGSSTAPPTTVPGPVYPLTGLPVSDEAAAARPALVVKIDNNKKARPQSGLNEADIVFEEIVEVQTRFAAVFHSQGADPVGPIRSGRTQDIDLLGSFNRPLFAWSGGNAAVTKAISSSDLVDLSALKSSVWSGGGFFRNADREAPHDEYAYTSKLWTLAPDGATAPSPQFEFRPPGDPAVGEPGAGVDLDMDGLPVEWRFDAATGVYWRTNGGTAHGDTLSGQINTHNVVVMVVDYRPSPADARSPEAQTIGTGEVLVFSGGAMVKGTWTRTDRLLPIVLADQSGNPILLTPGRTWVELARTGTATPVS